MSGQKFLRFKNLDELHKFQNRTKKIKTLKKKKSKLPEPSESAEAKAFMIWCEMHRLKYPELELIFHIPNGQDRDPKIGAILKSEGVKPGIPDYCLPVARFPFFGLYLELKRCSGSRGLTTVQKKWSRHIKGQGYQFCEAHGWISASEQIEKYLNLPKWMNLEKFRENSTDN